MKFFKTTILFSAMTALISLPGMQSLAQENTNYNEALRELDIMSNIFAADNQRRRNNPDVDPSTAGPYSSFDQATFLANQGMLFSFRMLSGSHMFFGSDFTQGFPGAGAIQIQIESMDENLSNIRRQFQDGIPVPNGNVFLFPGTGMNELEVMMDELRAEQESMRDLQLELRDLQRELSDAEGQEGEDIESQIAALQAELASHGDAIREQAENYRQSMSAYREAQQQQTAERNQLAVNEIMATLCDYGNTLRSLENDEFVTIVLRNFNNNLDQVYVFEKNDVVNCSSAEALLQSALSYQQ